MKDLHFQEVILTYTLTVREDTVTYGSRQEAIDAARERSLETRSEVRVEDNEGNEILCFRAGELASYLWDGSH